MVRFPPSVSELAWRHPEGTRWPPELRVRLLPGPPLPVGVTQGTAGIDRDRALGERAAARYNQSAAGGHNGGAGVGVVPVEGEAAGAASGIDDIEGTRDRGKGIGKGDGLPVGINRAAVGADVQCIGCGARGKERYIGDGVGERGGVLQRAAIEGEAAVIGAAEGVLTVDIEDA